MRRVMIASTMGLALAGLPLLAGCEETIEHQREVEVQPDGTRIEEERTVTQDPDTGRTTEVEEKQVDVPDQPR